MGLKIREFPVLPTRKIYVSVYLSVDGMNSLGNRRVFDTDSNSALMDNLANSYVWSIKEECFPSTVVKLDTSNATWVAMIGGF